VAEERLRIDAAPGGGLDERLRVEPPAVTVLGLAAPIPDGFVGVGVEVAVTEKSSMESP